MDDTFGRCRNVVSVAGFAVTHCRFAFYESLPLFRHAGCIFLIVADVRAMHIGPSHSPTVVAPATEESEMLKRTLVALTFVTALCAAGFGVSSVADAGHGCGYGYRSH
jgi:hypothetical protein